MTGSDQPLTKSGPPMAKPIPLLLRSLNGKALILTILGPPPDYQVLIYPNPNS